MPKLMMAPFALVEAVTDVLHGIPVTDPYRWLEEQESPRTREWLLAQHEYARSYFEAAPNRERIRKRIREFLDVETYDSIQKVGPRYFFRKRQPGQEQPSIYFRQGADGEDQLLIDPARRGTGPYTAVKPLRVSPDGGLLLYEVKEGGERTGTFEIVDVDSRNVFSDVLHRGYLRGFVFSPTSRGFYYVHEAVGVERPHHQAVYHHILGANFEDDTEIFRADESESVRVAIVAGMERLGFLVFHFLDKTLTDFYVWQIGSDSDAELVVGGADYKFGPLFLKDGRILAITDCAAPDSRIVEVRWRTGHQPQLIDIVPTSDARIQNWTVIGEWIFVSYVRGLKTEVSIFDFSGRRIGQLPSEPSGTVRLLGASQSGDELFLERESFTKPIQIWSYSPKADAEYLWAEQTVPFESKNFSHTLVRFNAKDGISIPMFLVGRRDVLERGSHPAIMTSYGGYGIPMTPRFSVFVAFLMERGCLFALPNIRGGSEFGAGWHNAAKRRKRQVAFDDFLAAAEWLIESGRTEPQKLAIFGGSNSGLLVGAAMTQRPDLFRAVVCMVPMLDMLRYQRFDNANVWKEEFGTSDDPEDFAALLRYSPYHNVRDGIAYPAVMMVSGDRDQNCNPLHARKMTARLQAASASDNPILLDYSHHRGHSPVLPLSERVEALTDRMAFLCDQLNLTT